MVAEEILKKRGKSIPNKKPLSVEVRKSIYMLIVTLLIIIILISIVYLLNSSQSTQKGHAVNQEQLIKNDLIEESRDLIHKIIEAQSFATIESSPIINEMVKPETIIYIEESNSE